MLLFINKKKRTQKISHLKILVTKNRRMVVFYETHITRKKNQDIVVNMPKWK